MNHKKMITNKDRLLHQEKKYEEAMSEELPQYTLIQVLY